MIMDRDSSKLQDPNLPLPDPGASRGDRLSVGLRDGPDRDASSATTISTSSKRGSDPAGVPFREFPKSLTGF
ncbi:MAG: hypothetical protein MZV70_70560 [Desulfobacterales bacterium]|nr:hypothetical protein [Desulfobacterales bacterium]